MCNKFKHTYNCFNPPALQRSVSNKPGVDQTNLEAERRESDRNRRRANRPANNAEKVYVLKDGERGDKSRTIVSGTNNTIRTEGSAALGDNDMDILYDYAGKIFDFFEKEFRRNSINGAKPGSGMPIIVKAHHRTENNMQVANAFWDLRAKQILVGEGDEVRKSYALDLTVVGHEYMHGVIQHTQKGLTKTNQAGAINESIADIFACMIVQYYNWQKGAFPDTTKKQKAADASWKVGEFIFKENDFDYVDGMAVRSLKNPGATFNHLFLSMGGQPSHGNNFIANKGPYYNCSIPSHAFYKLAIALGGHSWEKAGQIWYNALLENDNPVIEFKEWADLTVKETRKLFGRNDPAFDAIKKVWSDIGVL